MWCVERRAVSRPPARSPPVSRAARHCHRLRGRTLYGPQTMNRESSAQDARDPGTPACPARGPAARAGANHGKWCSYLFAYTAQVHYQHCHCYYVTIKHHPLYTDMLGGGSVQHANVTGLSQADKERDGIRGIVLLSRSGLGRCRGARGAARSERAAASGFSLLRTPQHTRRLPVRHVIPGRSFDRL